MRLIIFLAFLLIFPPASGREIAAKNLPSIDPVFILNSNHPGHATSDMQQDAILEVVRAQFPNSVPVIEYMDLKREPEGEYLGLMRSLMRKQYQHQKFAVVMTIGAAALKFASENRREIFHDAPLVFCGAREFLPLMTKGNITGTIADTGLRNAVSMMVQVKQNIREVFVLHDSSVTGLGLRRELESLLPQYANKVHFQFLPDLPLEDLYMELEGIPPESCLLMLSYTNDLLGRTYDQQEVARLLSKHIRAPIFDHSTIRLGYGVLGGGLADPSDQAYAAGRMAVRIISGENINRIPIAYINSSKNMFDYAQMVRFSIPVSALPANSLIINKPKTFFEAHQGVLLMALLIISILSLAILILSINIKKRQKLERELQKSEANYYDLYDNSPDAYFIVDFQTGVIVDCNRSFLHLTGYEKVDVLMQPLTKFYQEAEGEARQQWSPHIDEYSTIHISKRKVKCSDGSIKDVTLNKSAIKDAAGNITFVRSIWRDVSEQRQLEDNLLEAKEVLEKTFASVKGAYFIVDVETRRIVNCNPSATQMFGYDREEIIGRKMEFLFPSKQMRNEFVEKMQADLNKYGAFRSDYEMKRKDGRIFPTNHSVTEVLDKSGKTTYTVSVIHDLTERKQAEEALRQSEERFRKIFEVSPIGIALLDQDGRFVVANSTLLETLGYTMAELETKALLELIRPDDLTADGNIAQFFCGTVLQFSLETQVIHKSGHLVWVHLAAIAIHQDEAQPPGAICEIVDITDKKCTEEDILQQRAKLAHISRLATLGELAASIAHELNQPLTAILNNTQAARRFLDLGPPAINELHGILEDIIQDDKRAGKVLQHLRDFMKLKKVNKTSFQINDSIREVVRLLKNETLNKNVSVKLDLKPDLEQVSGDPIDVQQVLINLIMNSFDALKEVEPQRRRLLIRSAAESNLVIVSVKDNGTGIKEENMGNLFNAFYTTKHDGLGIGLSISKTLIKSHGGSLWAVNNEDSGATFNFTLPISGQGAEHDAG